MKKTIAIIGLGPRGVSLLERLLTNIINNKLSKKINFLLFDKNKAKGYGCHNPNISETYWLTQFLTKSLCILEKKWKNLV